MPIDFNGRVAIVTGAGAGLGREHALLLAARGAKVVVNDVGGSLAGISDDATAAQQVVEEIRQAGGEAVANTNSVADRLGAKSIVDTALEAFGRLDILVNNAGILRDKTFLKIDLDDLEVVLSVHLLGTIYTTHAAWPVMTKAGYGRIVMTTSVAGTVGNFGQSAYGAAKLGIVGLMNTLAIEGRRYGILVNAIQPGALTRMTEGLNPPAVDRYLFASLVSPAVAYLASEQCQTTGQIIAAQAGGFSRFHYFETEGVQFDPQEPVTPDRVADRFAELSDLSTATPAEESVIGRLESRLRSVGRWEE